MGGFVLFEYAEYENYINPPATFPYIMEDDVSSIFILGTFIFYYFIVPLGIIYGIWRLWDKERGISFIKGDKWPFKTDDNSSSNRMLDLKHIKIAFIVLLIISLPLWGLSTSLIAENNLRSEIRGGTIINPIISDPVVNTLGPSYNTDEIINEMEERRDFWMFDVLDEVIDFDNLTKIPGRLAVYQLDRGRYAVTYTYLSPIPMMRAYGFQFLLYEGGQRILAGSREETYIFPMYPDITGIANL